jgi:hypothetical protein
VDGVLVFEAGFAAFAVMRMHVDDPRQDGETAGVDYLPGLGLLAGLVDADDAAVADADRGELSALRRDQEAVADQAIHISFSGDVC